MIQDIYPDKLDNSYKPEAVPADDSPVYIFRGDSLLVRKGDGFFLPCFSDIKLTAEEHGASVVYAFSVNEEKRFLLLLPDEELSEIMSRSSGDPAAYDFCFMKVFDIRSRRLCDKTSLFALITAYHLSDWYKKNRFCGICASPMKHSAAERAMVCPHCKNTVYPRINPAVIVGVKDHDRLLLTKYIGRAEVPYYALIAGFTEIGETLEETVAREVMEEAGLAVKNIRYYKSQPWGRAGDILSGFFCDVSGSTDITIEEDELSLAEWMERSQVPGQPDNLSLTNEMMLAFRDGIII